MKKQTKITIIIALALIAALYAVFYIKIRTGVLDKIQYKDAILLYSKEYNVDPLLLEAIMKRESNMKASAVSGKGAVGLMQIMPKTGHDIALQLNVKDFNEDMLKDPDTNIKFGAFYMGKLLAYYKNNLVFALSAYNAGIGNVDSWIASSSDTIKIPFKDTKRHVKAILFTYSVYKGAERLRHLLKIKTA